MYIIRIARFTSKKRNSGPIKQLDMEKFFIKKLNSSYESYIYLDDDFLSKYNGNIFIKLIRGIITRLLVNYCCFVNLFKRKKIIYRFFSMDLFLPVICFVAIFTNSNLIIELHSKYGLIENQKFLRNLNKIILKLITLLNTPIISVTKDILAHYQNSKNHKLIYYPNGTIMPDLEKAHKWHNGQKINFIFTASAYHSWHGLEAIIKCFQVQNAHKFSNLHIVGRFEKFMIHYQNIDNIIFHGHMNDIDLNNLMLKMDVGIGSYPPLNFPLKSTSGLKYREYLSYGLPCFSGIQDETLQEIKKYFFFEPLDFVNFKEKFLYIQNEENYKKMISKSCEEFITKESICKNLINQVFL